MSHPTPHNPRAPRGAHRAQESVELPADQEQASADLDTEQPGDQPADQPDQPANAETPADETDGSAPAAPASEAAGTMTVPELTPELLAEQVKVRAEGQCGEPFMTKLRGGKAKTNLCGKPAGHDGPHGRIRVELPEAKKEVLDSFEFVPDEETVEYGAGRNEGERSDLQKQVDAQVKQVHTAWIGANKPARFNDSPRGRYFVDADTEKKYRAMLRSSATLHDVKVRVAPLQKHTSGKHMLVWTVNDKPAPTTPAAATPAETDSAPAPTPGAVETPQPEMAGAATE